MAFAFISEAEGPNRMRALLLFVFVSASQQPPADAVKIVKASYLDFNTFATLGFVFEGYRWFEEVSWTQETGENQKTMVTFTGLIDDPEATAVFEEKNKYKFGLALKALRLAPTYGLTKDKHKLRFLIRFQFQSDGGFDVHSGALGIRDQDGNWRQTPLDDKALLEVVTGIYANRDPYTCLVRGLPYK